MQPRTRKLLEQTNDYLKHLHDIWPAISTWQRKALISRAYVLAWKQVAPFPLRLAVLHSMLTILTLFFYPPAPQTPPILLPLTWAASYAVAVAIYPVVFPAS
jgi:hypothetical protein